METNFRCECHQCESFRANPPSQFQHQKECEAEKFVTWDSFELLEKSLMNRVEELKSYVAGHIDSKHQPPRSSEKKECPNNGPVPCGCDCHDKFPHGRPPPSAESTEKRCEGEHGVMCTCMVNRYAKPPILSPSDQSRITQIRANLEIFQEKGMDTSSWEATFFLELIEKLQKEIKSEK